ncbi:MULTISPECIES: hypothetical protein [Nostocales]|uniref:Uncharacterized protein n=3 Tax=Nostocales TaxID=1161 RepID=A0A0C1RM60_9CYAN|nr:hypothetical protein [Tolypothrix bouteillei]KAF3888018.1 hypothetical protein DA73_0400022900 [Tolypothrix bouteillei VB521301]
MKILQENPNNLTLQLRPWFTWIFSATFFLAGLSLAVFGGQVHTLKCRRDRSVCEASSASLLWSTQQTIPIANIQSAEIDILKDKKQNSYYQVLLLTDRKKIPVIVSTSDYETVEMWAKQIEVFLQKPHIKELVIQEDYRLEGYIVGGIFGSIFVLAGVMTLAIFGTVSTCTINKNLGKLTLHNRGLLNHSQTEYATQDILRVVVEKYRNNTKRFTYRVVLVMECGERVPFTLYFSSQLKEQQQIAEHISFFLGLKPAENLEIFHHPNTK